MKTVAITIGVGPVYESLANWSASLVQSYLGIETRIVSSNHLTYSLPNVPHPKNIWTLKFWAAIFESLNTESVGGIIKRTDSAEIV